jgi:hypothetical protein
MKISHINPGALGICLMLSAMSSVVHAQIYKWVDENGHTHYSQNPQEAGKAKAEEVKVKQQTGSSQGTSTARSWEKQDREFKLRRIQKQNQEAAEARAANTRPASLSGGRSGNTDESKCNLARDILNGAVRHTNGKVTDGYDKEVAQNDVKAYCH